jgi:lipopolysaccharide transport system permease protein
MLRDLLRYRDLLWLLTAREIRIRYARAALGVAWAVFPPLLMLWVFTGLDFKRLLATQPEYADVPYPLFAYLGLLPWAHFATSLTQATPSLVNLRDLLRKAAFPREVIPLSKVLAAGLDLAIGLAILAALLVHHRWPIPATAVALPAIFALQVAFTVGLALLLAAGNVYYRDVNYLVQVGLVLLMFASPVVYPLPQRAGPFARVLEWNPMASYLDGYRAVLLHGRWPGAEIVPGVVGAAIVLFAGTTLFRRCSAQLPEEV